jgi:hypothetical protein
VSVEIDKAVTPSKGARVIYAFSVRGAVPFCSARQSALFKLGHYRDTELFLRPAGGRHVASLTRRVPASRKKRRVGNGGSPQPISPNISQETLAEMIGTTRSRVSAFMNKFRKLGLIRYNGHIEVHNSLLTAVLHEKPQFKED